MQKEHILVIASGLDNSTQHCTISGILFFTLAFTTREMNLLQEIMGSLLYIRTWYNSPK